MLKRILKIIAIFILGMGGGIFADQFFWPYFVEKPLFLEYRLDKAPVYITERKEITIKENTALGDAIEKIEKAVIGVRTKTKTGQILEGTGIVITADGLALTLSELMPQAGEYSFFLNDRVFVPQVLKRDAKTNLVLAKIEEGNLSTVGFVDFSRLRLGERIFLVGVIFNKETRQKIVNEGIVKSFNDGFINSNISEKNNLKGSPLFNISGELMGINIIDSDGKIQAISIKKIKDFVGF